ncbi:MAG: NUMOD3 domain-containing DNA-binding protein [Nanoarchaeota archaeon]
MELIKDLGTKFIWEKWIRFGIFLCLFCNKKVERRLSVGLKFNSCGCQQYSKERNEKVSKSLKGKKHTEEHNKKISESKKGKKHTEEHNKKISDSTKGRIVSEETKKKHSKVWQGVNNPIYGVDQHGNKGRNWQDGISFEPYSPEFNKEKKQQVLERDNYTCQDPNCEHLSDKLDIHHIDYNKKNNNLENLLTLCTKCHGKTVGKNNRIYWIEFYQKIMGCLL